MSKITETNLTRSQLRAVLRYDPDTGRFFRILRDKRERPAGTVAGTDNHISILVLRHQYTGHALAWLYVHNKKRDDVYHVNGDKTDNRIANLAVP
jgi:hypothetical protein